MKHHLWLLLTLLCLTLPSPLTAQSPLNLRLDNVDSTAFPNVEVALTVRDADGVPVYGLQAANFELTEDRQPQARPLSDLRTEVNPEIEVSVLLALDISGSMQGQPLSDAQQAATRFLDRLTPSDRAALLAFADTVDLTPGQLNPQRERAFSPDKASLIDLIANLTAEGATPLYDAAFKAVRLTAQEPIGNRAVLLLTDGRDEDGAGGAGSAVANAESAIREANQANIPIFVIALGSEIDRSYLQRLALETGGTYQETPNSAELTTLFQNVADLLKQQYVLTYESALPADGQTHRLSVQVDLADRTASDEASFGPLPLNPASAPTATPEPTPQPLPTETPTATASPSPTASPTPTEPPPAPTLPPNNGDSTAPQGQWLIFGLLAVLLIGLGGALLAYQLGLGRTMYCRQCGYQLDKPGACPQCGSTQRVKKPRL